MNNCEHLGKATEQLIPEYYDSIIWGNIWKRKLESGTAFEWAVTAALIKAAKNAGYTVSVPLLESYNAPDYFVLRNEIPLTHGAQVGNSDTLLRSKPLRDRFLYCLVPKAVFAKDGVAYSLFREGCPYHKIMSGLAYRERTDIIIVPGTPVNGFPIVSENGKDILFSYDYNGTILNGVLSAVSSPYIPVKRREPRGGVKLSPKGIVECSVNKTKEIATKQLEKYDALFRTETEHPSLSIIAGNDLSSLQYDTHTIDLTTANIEQLTLELESSAKAILQNFALL